MKMLGLVALLLALGIQLLVFGYQTYLAMEVQTGEKSLGNPFEKQQDQMRKPSSIEEIPKRGPIQEMKYDILPDNPWDDEAAFRSRLRLGDTIKD